METEKVVLINVYYSESGYGDKLNFPPLGIAYISEYLDEKKIDHLIIDMGLGISSDEVLEEINHIKPSWIGISLNSLHIEKSKKLMEKLRINNPSTRMVVGGPHVTTQGKKIFEKLDFIDYAIIGEGEESFYELIINKPKSEIKGLVYKDDSKTIYFNERRITPNIETLPFPKFSKFKLDLYQKKTVPIISSRGCPFKCIFCQQSSLLSKEWRGVSAEHFIEIIKYWKNRGYHEIQILDDNFTFDSNRLKRMVELYEQEKITDIKLVLVGGVRVSSSTKENLLFLKKLGVDYLSFGIESFSDPVLNFIKKGTTEKKIEEAIINAVELNFKIRLFFIIGFPYQTVESLRKTYKFLLKYPIYQVRFFNLIPYENTALMDWLESNGELIYPSIVFMSNFKQFQDIPVFRAKYTLSPEERVKELKLARNFEKLISERAKYLFDELET